MTDGSVVAVDAIICATGFDTSYRPSFPVVAFGKDLRDLWQDEPKSYFSIAAAGLPNYFSQYSSFLSILLSGVWWLTCGMNLSYERT
jgi:cation diffusion facilitator CzcD-associated flavoprotein CzcO